MLLIPLVIALVAAAGALACRALGIPPHIREILFAAGACSVASEIAMTPILLSRGSNQAGVAQAGLIGSLIHLLACSVLGGALIIFKPLRLEPAFVYWLLGLYWLTLIVLVIAFVRAVQNAPVGTTTPAPAPQQRA